MLHAEYTRQSQKRNADFVNSLKESTNWVQRWTFVGATLYLERIFPSVIEIKLQI